MIEVGRISSIWRYPVKSMAGERIPEAGIGEFGLHADRTWAVRDVADNATTGAKKLPGLLMCTARYAQTPPPEAGPGHAPEVIVGLPDGAEFSSSEPGIHRALSAYLDRDVTLEPLAPVGRRDRYRGPVPTKAELRKTFGLEDGEPLPDMSVFPIKKLAELTRYGTPVGSYADAYPVHIITEQTLSAMVAIAPDTDFDVRRFRPTILVDSPSTSPEASNQPELEWCGGDLHLPHAILQPLIPTIRCVMPALEQPGLDRDPSITRAVAKHSRRCLGVYGAVVRPGRIAEGEALQLDSQKNAAGGLATLPGAAIIKRLITRAASATLPRGGRA